MRFSLRVLGIAPAILLLSALSLSQISDTATSNAMAKRIVDLLNKGDGKGLESLATADFLQSIPKGALVGLAFGVKARGSVGDPELVLDLGEQRHYKVTIRQEGKPDAALLLVLGVESADKFFSIGVAPYRDPAVRPAPFKSDNPLKSSLDKAVQGAVDRYRGQNNPIGISIGVLRDGKPISYNYGATDSRTGAVPTSQTIYEIGSITKTMTGILIGRAILDSKLSLDDDIRKFLPGAYPNLEFEGTPIRIRDLVTHRSGLPANPPGIPDDAGAPAYASYSHEKLLADLGKVKLTRKPGAEFSYSNMGAGVCGLILEKAYGAPYEALLQKYIFQPAKMKSSGLTLSREMESRYATPYDGKGAPTERWTVNGIESAGAVRSNAQDMIGYARLNLDEKSPAVALSHRVQTPPGSTQMGLFWQVGDSRTAGPYFMHEGGTGGFTSNVIVMPREKIAVVVMMNSGEQNAGQLGYEIVLRYLNAARSGHSVGR